MIIKQKHQQQKQHKKKNKQQNKTKQIILIKRNFDK